MHMPHTPARTAAAAAAAAAVVAVRRAAALAHARHGWVGRGGEARLAQAPMILSSRDAHRPSGPPVCGSGGGSGGAPMLVPRASAPAARARCVACASVWVYVRCARGF